MKKFLSILIGLLILLTILPCAAFPDTKNTDFENAVNVLEGLGIVQGNDEGLFSPEQNVTRAEMTAMILRTMGMKESNGRNIFSDVPASHWAYAFIADAYDMKIINGVDEKKFEPDSAVTKEQAVKMVVCMLGYGIKADSLGGFPAGHLSVAMQLDLLNGIDEGNFSRGKMAKLLYNSLSVSLFEKTSFGDASGEFKASENTILSDYLNVDVFTGYVSATKSTEIEIPFKKLSESEVLLSSNKSGTRLIADGGNTNVSSRIGVSGTFYIRKSADDTYNVLAYVPQSDTNILTIPAEKITGTTKTEITFEGETKSDQRKETFQNPTVIINGSVKTDWTNKDIWPDMGSVKFVVSGNKEYLIVESYQNYIVQSVNKETETVTFKEGLPVIIDAEDENVLLQTDISAFAEWGVLSVAKGTKKTKYEYAYNILTGKVTEIFDKSAVIGGVTYPIASSLINSETLTKLSLGQDCAYSLDVNGAVAAVNTKHTETYKYGILVNAETKKGIDAEPQLKIFTQDGQMVVYELTDTIIFADYASGYGEQNVNSSQLIGENIYNSIYAGGKVIRQLLRYELNDNNEITRIDTAADYTYRINDNSRYDVFSWDSLTGSNRLAITSDGKTYEDGINGIYMGGDLGTFVGRAAPRAKTKFFVMPDSDSADDKEYAVRAYYALSHNNDGEKYTNMHFYDIDDECIIGAMVWVVPSSGGTASVSYPDNMLDHICVTSVVKALNDDGEPCVKVSGYKWKYYEQVTFTVNEDFECLYKMATANIYEDKAWYTKMEGSTPVRDIPEKGQERGAMFMKAADIGFGDIIQVNFTAGGDPKVISVRYRGEYPGEYEGGISNGKPSFGTKNEYYIHGVSEYTVDKITDYGYVTTAKLYATPGYFTEKTITRMISNAPVKVLFLDRKAGTHSFGTKDDVIIGDTLIRVSQTTGSYMLIVVR